MNSEQLAIDGGAPVRPGEPIPLSKVCWDEGEQRAVQRVFQSGFFCSVYEEAAEVKALEKEFAHRVGARHAVAFNSGTTAQHAALVALGIGPGAEVIVPPLTFISTAYTVLIAGAVPVFADVCRDTITIDPHDIEQKLSPRTKAIVPVHWFGHPADMDAIVSLATGHDLAVIEDCAHGPGITLHGRQTGSFGQISCWSLQQSKILTAAGEGGLATTDDDVLAARLRQVCDHGKEKSEKAPSDLAAPYRVTALGNNYRLGEMHAAFARAQLSKLDDLQRRRRSAYVFLHERLCEVPGLQFQIPRPGAGLSYYCFPVLFPSESFSVPVAQINAAMHAEGIGTHPIALDELCHVHPLFATAAGRATASAYQLTGDAPIPDYGWGTLPVAEKIANELLLLPMHPDLSEQDLDDIIVATRKVAAAYRR
jgi:dTDP-4-amino-4,6-dideoxygalactose transaminase